MRRESAARVVCREMASGRAGGESDPSGSTCPDYAETQRILSKAGLGHLFPRFVSEKVQLVVLYLNSKFT